MLDLNILIYGNCYNDKISQSLSYYNLMFPYGDITLLTPNNMNKRMLDYDVLVLPGGADVNPARYGEKPSHACGRADAQYEYLDTTFLAMWIATGKPIIGICRGLQTLNVAMGGSLFQDVKGHMGRQDHRDEEWHDIFTDINDGTEGGDFRVHGVNSFHHQAIKQLAPGFDMIGWGYVYKNCPTSYPYQKKHYTMGHIYQKDKHGTIKRVEGNYLQLPEIIRHKTLPYIAFQYHPEDMNCPLFHKLVAPILEGVAAKQEAEV